MAGRASLRRAYSSRSPSTLPVFGLTKCSCWHARHVIDWYVPSSISDTSSANHPCTLEPVFGHRNRNDRPPNEAAFRTIISS
jgi:hypothetical protein